LQAVAEDLEQEMFNQRDFRVEVQELELLIIINQ
jgi:hypothetical protein